ncbi:MULTISPECIES: hypothetical protein [Dyella]|uniref:Lipoprotein n=2 Tax=Dyella TaxID=231454 RepID=A0A4R0YIM4_9GAMM|nr:MULTISPECIES: hypothetical protein [Dyella]TBR36281.1 hypothetical protein EYV96_16990 [Dyella terrae]TCI05937.1 hypothetical protein EZM97_36080 [Dyella soli]
MDRSVWKVVRMCVAVALISACSTMPLEPSKSEYAALSAEPAPSEWAEGSIWTFSFEESGKIYSFTYKVTKEPISDCASGAPLELVPVGEGANPKDAAAYRVFGRVLVINLNPRLCDSGGELRGVLDGPSFRGVYDGSTFISRGTRTEATGHRVDAQ